MPKAERTAGKQLMTQEILDLMECRRNFKNRSPAKYREINQLIRREIKQARETWIEQFCRDIENLQRKHNDFNLHKKLKDLRVPEN